MPPQDPDVKLRGIRAYAKGVRRIFDQKTSRAELISCSPNATVIPTSGATGVVSVIWRLSGKVNLGPLGLEIKPYLVFTDLHVSPEGLVIFQEDTFSIPSWDILLSAIAPKLPFLAPPAPPVPARKPPGPAMKRPLLDRIATTLFNLETARVSASSTKDDQGRMGEPYEWSDSTSFANRFSEIAASGFGYSFKQGVADLVAGSAYDKAATQLIIDEHVASNKVAMFSFTTCPFCRRAKDYLNENGIGYSVIELDERADGNALRAELGRRTRRTSVPSIFINGEYVGGCNDGPGLLPLANSGQLSALLAAGGRS